MIKFYNQLDSQDKKEFRIGFGAIFSLLFIGILILPSMSSSSSCSASDMKRLARERASLNGRVTQVGKIRMGNFNYSAQFYPKNITGRYEIWLKIECINGEAKVTDAKSFKVD